MCGGRGGEGGVSMGVCACVYVWAGVRGCGGRGERVCVFLCEIGRAHV